MEESLVSISKIRRSATDELSRKRWGKAMSERKKRRHEQGELGFFTE